MSGKLKKHGARKSSGSSAAPKNKKSPPAADTLALEYVGLSAAWRNDFGQGIEKIAEHVNTNFSDIELPLNGPQFLHFIQERIGLALEFVILDSDEQGQFGGEPRSYTYALDRVMDLAVRFLCGDQDGIPVESQPGDSSEKIMLIQSCMIALIARGEVYQAWKLGRMLGAVLWIAQNLDKTGMLKQGPDKEFGPEKDKIKLLVALAKCIKARWLPSKKALRLLAFPKGKQESNFSKMLSNMEIGKYIPNEPTGYKGSRKPKAPNDAAVHPIKPSKDWEAAWGALNDHLKSEKRENLNPNSVLMDAEPDTAPWCSIKPSGDPKMVSWEIRKIRDSLGTAYWVLLIQFGMGELETPQDLELFVEKLGNIGLDLI